MIVQLERFPQFIGLVREEEFVTDAIDDYRIRLAQGVYRSQHHVARHADQRRVIHAHHDDYAKIPVECLRSRSTLKQRHGPFDPRHAAHAIQVVVRKRLHLVEVLRFAIHHPEIGVRHIHDLAGGTPHDSGEDRALVGH